MRYASLLVLAGAPFAFVGVPNHRIAANEASAIGHLMDLARAEAAYQSANGGFYDEVRCLAAPATCIPRYDGPPFLEPARASLQARHGYHFRFHAGPGAGRSATPGLSSASSMARFAFTAVPLRQGVTGSRWFCVDQDFMIREPEGRPLTAPEGGCGRGARTMKAAPASSPEDGESRTIADLRILVSAQHAYAVQNGGFFDRLDCLAEPWRCMPSMPGDAPIFLDPQVASLTERHGYKRRFYPGATPPVNERAGCSPTSMRSYAYTAVPALPGRTGRRGFCADSNDRLCETADGREPRVVDGQCEPCVQLR